MCWNFNFPVTIPMKICIYLLAQTGFTEKPDNILTLIFWSILVLIKKIFAITDYILSMHIVGKAKLKLEVNIRSVSHF